MQKQHQHRIKGTKKKEGNTLVPGSSTTTAAAQTPPSNSNNATGNVIPPPSLPSQSSTSNSNNTSGNNLKPPSPPQSTSTTFALVNSTDLSKAPTMPFSYSSSAVITKSTANTTTTTATSSNSNSSNASATSTNTALSAPESKKEKQKKNEDGSKNKKNNEKDPLLASNSNGTDQGKLRQEQSSYHSFGANSRAITDAMFPAVKNNNATKDGRRDSFAVQEEQLTTGSGSSGGNNSSPVKESTTRSHHDPLRFPVGSIIFTDNNDNSNANSGNNLNSEKPSQTLITKKQRHFDKHYPTSYEDLGPDEQQARDDLKWEAQKKLTGLTIVGAGACYAAWVFYREGRYFAPTLNTLIKQITAGAIVLYDIEKKGGLDRKKNLKQTLLAGGVGANSFFNTYCTLESFKIAFDIVHVWWEKTKEYYSEARYGRMIAYSFYELAHLALLAFATYAATNIFYLQARDEDSSIEPGTERWASDIGNTLTDLPGMYMVLLMFSKIAYEALFKKQEVDPKDLSRAQKLRRLYNGGFHKARFYEEIMAQALTDSKHELDIDRLLEDYNRRMGRPWFSPAFKIAVLGTLFQIPMSGFGFAGLIDGGNWRKDLSTWDITFNSATVAANIGLTFYIMSDLIHGMTQPTVTKLLGSHRWEFDGRNVAVVLNTILAGLCTLSFSIAADLVYYMLYNPGDEDSPESGNKFWAHTLTMVTILTMGPLNFAAGMKLIPTMIAWIMQAFGSQRYLQAELDVRIFNKYIEHFENKSNITPVPLYDALTDCCGCAPKLKQLSSDPNRANARNLFGNDAATSDGSSSSSSRRDTGAHDADDDDLNDSGQSGLMSWLWSCCSSTKTTASYKDEVDAEYNTKKGSSNYLSCCN